MSKFLTLLLCLSLVCSNQSFGCFGCEDHEKIKEFNLFMRSHADKNRDITYKYSNNSEIEEKLKSYVDFFHYDNNLRVNYGSLLLKNYTLSVEKDDKKLFEAIQFFAQALLMEEDDAKCYADRFFDSLGFLRNKKGNPFTESINEIYFLLNDKDNYFRYKKGIKNFEKFTIGKLEIFFISIKDIPILNLYDGLFYYVKVNLIHTGRENYLPNLIKTLYDSHKNSSLLNINYAILYLPKIKQHQEAISMLKTILTEDEENNRFYQIGLHYNLLGIFCTQDKEYELAEAAFKKATTLEFNISFLMNHVKSKFLGEKYQESLDDVKNILDILNNYNNVETTRILSDQEKLKYLSSMQKLYLIVLGKLNRTDEVQKFLLDRQEQKISNLRKKGSIIKHLIELSKKDLFVSPIVIKQSDKKFSDTLSPISHKLEKSDELLTPQFGVIDTKKEILSEEIVSIKKKKVKTRGKNNKLNTPNHPKTKNNPKVLQEKTSPLDPSSLNPSYA